MSFHIGAKAGDIADTVLLPGDPLRAKYLADTMFDQAFQYNEVRGMLGYTGFYKGKRVSVQGTGMGMPSLAVYVHELINDYNVKNLIRIGTSGAIQRDLPLRSIILATSASGDSGALYRLFDGMDFSAAPDFSLLLAAYEAAQRLNIPTIQGGIFSTDTFYQENESKRWDLWTNHGILAAEMETQMLYTIAARFGVRALSILTVSDNIITGESLTSEEKESSLYDMLRLALEVA
jgi:purine-nucleoside phosphorylase